MSDLHIFTHDDRCRVASWKSVILLIVKKEWTMAGVQAWARAIDFTITKSQAGYACITVIEERASMLRSAESRALMRLARTKTQPCTGSAIVIEGTGFAPATKRTVVASVNLLLQRPFPNRAFADRVDAINGLTPYIPPFNSAPVKEIELDMVLSNLAS